MRAPLVVLAVALAFASIAACTQSPVILSPRAMNRPARIAFVCFEGNTPVELARCQVDAAGAVPAGLTLLALVPQQTRGEVGAVDLTLTTPRVIDSDQRVPGFTFIAVGEIPSAIAVSETSPVCTWVANRGSRDIHAIRTARFRQENADAEMLPLIGSSPSVVDGRPTSMVLADGALYVALPEDSIVLRVAVDETACTFGEVTAIEIPRELAALDVPPAIDPGAYVPPSEVDNPATLGVCPQATALPLLAPVPSAVGEVEPLPVSEERPLEVGVDPRPLELVLDRATNAIFVADQALPVIHRLDLATRTFGSAASPPIRTDAPIRDLTITPPVPDSFDPGAPTRRYVYAIDDRDGRVMVIELESRLILPVAATTGGDPYRLPLPAQARAIEAFDTGTPAAECTADLPTEQRAGPAALRGIFVGVALSDGTVRFVDVLDRDAPCRGGPGCEAIFASNETVSFIRRHRIRIGQFLSSGVVLDNAPSAVVTGSSVRYGDNGQASELGAAPRFFDLGECTPGLGRVFPRDGSAALICMVTDPWSAQIESWSIVWRGSIPGTTTAGNFDIDPAMPGTITLDSRIDACARGVLGPEGAAAAGAGDPEAGYGGDMLAITESIPEERRAMDPVCAALVREDASGDPRPILVPFREVRTRGEGFPDLDAGPYVTRFVLDASAPVIDGPQVTIGGEARAVSVGEAIGCFDNALVTLDVRVRDRYRVAGSRSGLQHRTVRAPDGECVIDLTLPVGLQGRAAVNQRFTSDLIELHLGYDPQPGARPDVAISFQLGQVPRNQAVDLGASDAVARAPTLPTELVYSGITGRLYALDSLRRGLAPIQLAPVRITSFVE
jgi:hypothetical protein